MANDHVLTTKQTGATSNQNTEIIPDNFEALIKSLISGFNDAVYVHPTADVGFANFIEVNEEACQRMGYSREELLKLSPKDIDAHEKADIDRGDEGLSRLMKKGHAVFESVHVTKSGIEFPVEISANVFSYLGQSVIISVVRDLSERQEAQDAQRRFEQIMSATDDLLSFVDAKYIYRAINDAYLEAHNMSRESIIGQSVTSLMGEDVFQNIVKDNFDRALSGETVCYSSWFDYAGKGRRYVDVAYKPFADIDDVIKGVVVTVHDVTELHEVKLETLKQENRLNRAQRMGHIGCWEMDLVKNKLWWSDETYRLFDIDPKKQQADYEMFLSAIFPADREKVNQAYQLSIKNHEPYNIVHRLQLKDGDIKYVREHCDTIFDDSGTPLRSFGTVHDITEQVLAEQEQEKLQAQLSQLQKMESVGRLAGGVAHDFNNMLSVILGHTELALMDLDPSSQLFSDLKEIETAAKRSTDLTRQLLAFARKQTVNPKVLDLNENLSGTLQMLQRLIGEEVNLSWAPGTESWPIMVDPGQLTQVIANLCVNARDAINGVGNISIETANVSFDDEYCVSHVECTPGDYVVLSVTDNGCGMESSVVEQAFEPFYTTKSTGQGTGLGLSMVYGIVKQNHGFINVYSELGIGSTFRVYLPRHQGEAEYYQAPAKSSELALGNETVLLVEDEPTILSFVQRMLKQLGYSVLAVNSPGEALKVSEEYSSDIHLLMTDVMMPLMNGRDLSDRIQKTHPKIRVLFMSGFSANVIAHHDMLEDSFQFIQKPFSMQNLGFKVQEVLFDESPD